MFVTAPMNYTPFFPSNLIAIKPCLSVRISAQFLRK